MHLPVKRAFVAILLGSTFAVTSVAAPAATTGCQKTEAEGGAGGNWQLSPGAGTQKTEAEGGAGGNWQQSPGAGIQKTEAKRGAGAVSQQAMAQPCK
jgi:hypothetical protein